MVVHLKPSVSCLAALPLALAALSACDTRGRVEAPGAVLVREPDLRTPKKAPSPPPPIHGGTLLALDDGQHVVVGDPDRHRLLGVSLTGGEVLFERDLGSDVLPGRMAEDALGQVHVVLRGTGELLSLDPLSGETLRRAPVCPEPRGLAYEPSADALHLACADGTLWSYAAETGERVGKQFIAPDLRDVALAGDGALWVSTFRGARVFHVAADGTVDARPPLPPAERVFFEEDSAHTRTLVARGAWRLVSAGDGTALVAHQRAAEDEIEIEPHAAHVPDEHRAEVVREPLGGPSGGASNAYGGGAVVFDAVDQVDPGITCDAIVHAAVTRIAPGGNMATTASLSHVILPVDVAVSPNGTLAAVVSAGHPDEGAPKARIVVPETGDPAESTSLLPEECVDCEPRRGSVQLLRTAAMVRDNPVEDFCFSETTTVAIPEPAIAVQFVQRPIVQLVVQTREPSRLYLVGASSGEIVKQIELGGASVADTGHDLFHRNSGGGLACASCHLEGQDDSHTWKFSGLGKRRTQPLNVKLRGTEPFHWDGAMEGLGAIMSEVFVGRMGGAPQSSERLDALTDWVLELTPPQPVRPSDDPAARRGKALFESTRTGCTACHSGPKLTNNQNADVGTSGGAPLQVPSLLGVAQRLPLMHDGCAKTLAERFEPDCGGGDAHGTTSQLSDAEIDDLVAYLESL